jgi:nonribosomal peptide synthetase DhbF
MGELVGSGGNPNAFDVLLPIRPHGSRRALFCVHPAGGIGWCYAGLIARLGREYPVYALQARGIAAPAVLPDKLEDIAADYVAQIRAVQPNGPYHLLGWSFGGLVAHSMATLLQAEGDDVDLLAILDAYPAADLGSGARRDGWEHAVHAALLGAAGYDPARFQGVTLEQRDLVAILGRSDSAMARLDDDTLSALVAVFLNNGRLAESFVPGRVTGDLLLFGAVDDRPDDLAPAAAWQSYVTGAVEHHEVRCGHQAMLRPAALDEIVGIVAEKMDAKHVLRTVR